MAVMMSGLSLRFISTFGSAKKFLGIPLSYDFHLLRGNGNRMHTIKLFPRRSIQTKTRITIPGTSLLANNDKASSDFLRDKKLIPGSEPPSTKDIELLYEFIDRSSNLVVLTGAGISTECGIPDYRSPNGAYSSGFKPITHQEFLRSSKARRRYWARSYAGWRRFTAALPGAAHYALASLEKSSRINFMITQNVDRYFIQDEELIAAITPKLVL